MKITFLLSFLLLTLSMQGASPIQKAGANKSAAQPVIANPPKPVIDSSARKDIQALKTDVANSRDIIGVTNTTISITALLCTVFGLVLATATFFSFKSLNKMHALEAEVGGDGEFDFFQVGIRVFCVRRFNFQTAMPFVPFVDIDITLQGKERSFLVDRDAYINVGLSVPCFFFFNGEAYTKRLRCFHLLQLFK